MDLALNNLQRLICHKTQQNKQTIIPTSQKMMLDASLLNTQHYKVRIKDKLSNTENRVAPSPTPRGSIY